MIDIEKDNVLESIAMHRKKIDLIDHFILDQIEHRIKEVREIARLKKRLNLAAEQPERFAEIIEERKKYIQGKDISETFLNAMLMLFHDEAVSVQENIFSDFNP